MAQVGVGVQIIDARGRDTAPSKERLEVVQVAAELIDRNADVPLGQRAVSFDPTTVLVPRGTNPVGKVRPPTDQRKMLRSGQKTTRTVDW